MLSTRILLEDMLIIKIVAMIMLGNNDKDHLEKFDF